MPEAWEGSAASAGMRPIPIVRRADHIVHQVRDLIVAERLQVGQRLPSERVLAARFDASRAIVSQALRTLALMGLIEIRPGSSTYVTRNATSMMHSSIDLLLQLSDGNHRQLADFRLGLERAGAMLGLGLRSTGLTDRLRRHLEAMDRSRGFLASWIRADSEFHSELVDAGRNPYISGCYHIVHTSVIERTYDRWVTDDQPPGWFIHDFPRQQQLHHRIYEAFAGGRAEALDGALQDHHAALLAHLEHSSAT